MQTLFKIVGSFLLSINLAWAAVNINTATQEELQNVKGIGPSKAKSIIEYRTQNGAFQSLEDLAKVKGFAQKTIDKLKNELSVGDETSVQAETSANQESAPSAQSLPAAQQ